MPVSLSRDAEILCQTKKPSWIIKRTFGGEKKWETGARVIIIYACSRPAISAIFSRQSTQRTEWNLKLANPGEKRENRRPISSNYPNGGRLSEPSNGWNGKHFPTWETDDNSRGWHLESSHLIKRGRWEKSTIRIRIRVERSHHNIFYSPQIRGNLSRRYFSHDSELYY